MQRVDDRPHGDRDREGSSHYCRCWRRCGGTGSGTCDSGAAMIPVAAGVRIWIASGHTDMRKGMNGLALLVQEGLGRDPFAGDVFVFRGRAGSLIKALWHDGIGLSAAQMSYLLEAIDWRNPQHTWRPFGGQAPPGAVFFYSRDHAGEHLQAHLANY